LLSSIQEIFHFVDFQQTQNTALVLLATTEQIVEIYSVLGYSAAQSGDSVPTFREYLSVRNYHSALCIIPEQRRYFFTSQWKPEIKKIVVLRVKVKAWNGIK
jgi:hypothetical protein